MYFSAPSHPPPPYDSQGETYRLINDTEEDNSSPLETTENLQNGLQNSYRYPRAKHRRINGNPYPRELKKFLAAAIFMGLNFLATTVSLSVVHEWVPNYQPLPDIVLDSFKYQEWGLTASEVLLSIQVTTAIMVCIFHKHRYGKYFQRKNMSNHLKSLAIF